MNKMKQFARRCPDFLQRNNELNQVVDGPVVQVVYDDVGMILVVTSRETTVSGTT